MFFTIFSKFFNYPRVTQLRNRLNTDIKLTSLRPICFSLSCITKRASDFGIFIISKSPNGKHPAGRMHLIRRDYTFQFLSDRLFFKGPVKIVLMCCQPFLCINTRINICVKRKFLLLSVCRFFCGICIIQSFIMNEPGIGSLRTLYPLGRAVLNCFILLSRWQFGDIVVILFF